ncbi:MAG: potassium transporter TrkG [Actinomycetota bacterium]|nr:potassium transporter TrkG [Actinomycetota bacterium]
MTPRLPVRAPTSGVAQRLTGRLLSWIASFIRTLSKGKIESAVGVTVGAVWVLSAPLFLICSLADFLDGGSDFLPLLLTGAAVEIAGLLVVRLSSFPPKLPISRLFAAVVCGALAALIAVTAAHLATGVAHNLDVALVEAAATITGTNASTINPELLSLGMLLFRALGQWLAAAAIIIVLVRVLPHLGVGGLDADGGVATRSARRLAPRSGSTMARLVTLYIALTGLLGFAFLLAGMPFKDSIVHALTTISSGGFSSRLGSIGSFDSAPIEWVAIFGMFVAGTSLPLIFRAMRRGDLHRFVRSVEFRVYVGLIATVTFALLAWSDGLPSAASIRHAIFHAVSSISTTGHIAGDFNAISFGGEALLLVLMVVGGMSASVAGGFKVMRFMVLGQYIGRELRRSVHPTVVEKIHLGRSSIGETALARIIGELFLATMLLVPTVLVLSADGLDLEGAFTFAVSIMSNVGVGFGEFGPLKHLGSVGAFGHLVAALLMVIGRISITPVLVAMGGIGEPAQSAIRRWRMTRREVVIR